MLPVELADRLGGGVIDDRGQDDLHFRIKIAGGPVLRFHAVATDTEFRTAAGARRNAQ